MKKLITFALVGIITVVILPGCGRSTSKKEIWQNRKTYLLKGDVKSVKTCLYHVQTPYGIHKGNEVDYAEISPAVYLLSFTILGKTIFFGKDGLISKLESKLNTTVFKYNNQGIVSQMENYLDNEQKMKMNYKYAYNGNQVIIQGYIDNSLEGKYIMNFNNKGLPVKQTCLLKNGSLLSETTTGYNDKNEPVKISGKGSNNTFSVDYSYNNEGNISNATIKQNGQNYVYEYYGYEMDNVGNWTKVYVKSNNKPAFVIEREVTYY